jgi:glyoxylase-like metal-dependent hydrolase (beta-lactamase superfamily II)
MKKILIGIVIVVVVILLAAFLFYKLRIQPEMKKMSPLPTQKVNDTVSAVNDVFVNMYLIKGKTKYIAVDGGKDVKTIEMEMKNLGIDKKDVVALFLTHADSDHTAAADYLTDATIYLSRAEVQMVNGTKRRMLFFRNKLNREYTTLEDGQVTNVDGLSIKAILTPGHTPGSTCYLIEGKYLFTGDSMSLQNGRAEVFSKVFNMDSATQKISLGKLAQLSGVKSIFTAHHGYTDDFAKAFENWKKKQ